MVEKDVLTGKRFHFQIHVLSALILIDTIVETRFQHIYILLRRISERIPGKN